MCGKESKHRPDFVYDCKTHVVIVEVDEHQHKSNCSKGEINRMRNIYFAYEGIPVVFVRYNPDSFVYRGKKVEISQQKREDILLRWVEKAMNISVEVCLSVIYLFYDGYYEGIKDFESIDPYKDVNFECDCGEIFYVYLWFEEHCFNCPGS